MAALRYQNRRDTAANWTAANPVLLAGEVGFETDTYKLKIGDGTTAWSSLAYLGGLPGPGEVTLSMLQNIATDRILGRDTAGAGAPEELTVGNGLAFTGSGGIGIADDGVTYARMQNVSAASRLIGRGGGAGAGDPEELSLGNGLQLTSTTLDAKVQMSVTTDGSGLKLSGDAASPGVSKLYGTNLAGTKGWYNAPDVGFTPPWNMTTIAPVIIGASLTATPGITVAGSTDQGYSVTSNRVYYVPFFVTKQVTLSDVLIRVKTGVAASTCELGIYAGDGTAFAPGTRLGVVTALSTASSNSTVTATFGTPLTLAPGVYWVAAVFSSSSVVIRGAQYGIPLRQNMSGSSITENIGLIETNTSLPATGTATGFLPAVTTYLPCFTIQYA